MEYRKPLPKQIKIIQTLRAVACLSVVVLHLWHDKNNIVIQKHLNELFKAGGYGVQIFFIISGFILPYSLRNKNYSIQQFFKFMARRLTRLEPVYIASIALALFLSYYLAPKIGIVFEIPARSLKDIWLHLLYLVPFVEGAKWVQNVNWTLAIEFQFYIMIGLTAPIIMNKSSNKVFKHILLIALVIFGIVFNQHNMFPIWVPFFGAGITLFLYLNKTFSMTDLVVQFIIFSAALWFNFHSIYFIIILIGTPLVIYKFFNYNKLPLQFIGKISYSIYLVHNLIGVFVNNLLLDRFPESSLKNQIFIVTISFASSILAAWLFFVIFEKPFVKLSKKITL